MCTEGCQKKFASAPSFKNGTRNAPSHSPLASKTQETLCDGRNGTCMQTPGQREQRFCSSPQVIRNGFYILPPGICIITYYYHGKVGLRPPTRDKWRGRADYLRLAAHSPHPLAEGNEQGSCALLGGARAHILSHRRNGRDRGLGQLPATVAVRT